MPGLLNSIKTSSFIKIFLFYQFLTRLVLTNYAIYLKQVEYKEIVQIFFSGLINDLVATIYGIAFLMTLKILILKILKKPLTRKWFEYGSFIVLNFIFLSNLLGELFFWDEFSTRYNFIAVDYLVYTQEIIHTVIESVPVFKIIFAVIIFILCLSYYKRNKIRDNIKAELFPFSLYISALILTVFLYFFYTPEKILSKNNQFASELQKNGPYEFVYAFFHNELDYNKFYPTINSHEAINTVRSLLEAPNVRFIDNNSITREVSPYSEQFSSDSKNLPNFVLIVVESLSASYMNIFGSKNNLTPNIEKIANDGILFTNFYATGTRTVRGLEAIVKSIPPTPGSSIVRRSNNENIFTIATILKPLGYNLDFIYGGYGYFDNMNYFFGNNGFSITDRNNFSKDEITFANVWGVSDGDVANKMLKILDKRHQEKKPFFSLFMTTSNHRPYTFPEGSIDAPQGKRESAVLYTDYSIGKFIEDAKKKDWFDNTIFVIVADHCASSAGKTTLPKDKYHIPFIIYSPKYLQNHSGIKNPNLGSQIDVIPTLLSIAGMKYTSKFYGVDLLNTDPQRAFIGTYQLLGYFTNNGSVLLSPNKPPISEGENKLLLEHEAISFYQSAYEFFKEEQMLK